MKIRAISAHIGVLLIGEGLLLLPALALALYYGEFACAWAFAGTACLCAACGWWLYSRKKAAGGITAREGFVLVSLGWILLTLFGAVPYFASGAVPNVIDSLFEAASGFTTTGASVLKDVENFPKSLLYWRSFSAWAGGLGVLLMMLVLIPGASRGGEKLHLFRTEPPAQAAGKRRLYLQPAARRLCLSYLAMTTLLALLLLLGGLPLFDSLLTALSAAGTGGFSVKNAGIAAYNSAYVNGVLAVFMVLCGVNFSLYASLLRRRVKQAFKNTEFKVYLAVIAITTLLLFGVLYPSCRGDYGNAALNSFFHAASALSTTGFYTANFAAWPPLARMLLVVLMLLGGCSGTASGGFKVSRVVLLCKALRTRLSFMLRPRAVRPVRLNGKPVDDDVVNRAFSFLVAYLLLCLVSIELLSLDGFAPETTATAVIASLSNMGPGLAGVGPFENYALFSGFSKLVLIADMLLGRLEIFPLLLLFSPDTWKRKA